MRRGSWIVVLLLLASVAAFAEDPAPSAADPAAPPRGAELLAPFKVQLMEALRAGLEQGPAEAISACQMRAPEIASALSRDGVSMGRSSHRLRNPANVAPAWVAPILAAYVADATDRSPRTLTLDDGRAGYVEPIVVAPMCVTCHGKTLAPEVAARIHELYPDDAATGFEVGDLRGVFWVAYPADPAP